MEKNNDSHNNKDSSSLGPMARAAKAALEQPGCKCDNCYTFSLCAEVPVVMELFSLVNNDPAPALAFLNDLLRDLAAKRPSRELALTVMKLDEAQMWYDRAHWDYDDDEDDKPF